jgi:hypothetical protein
MRTALCIAIGVAVAVSGVPASFAQDSRVLDHCKAAGTAIEAEERQTPQGSGNNTGVSVEVPIGSVCVAPEFVGDEPIYVRRTSGSGGMTIVEVSTTPFVPVLHSNKVAGLIGRPDQPASW